MHPKVDRGADTIQLDLTEAAIADSREVAAGVVAAYDADGFIVALENRDASRRNGDHMTTHGPL